MGSEEEGHQVGELIKTMLPPPQTVFTTEFFHQPIFPVSVVKDVAELYGALEVPAVFLQALDEDVRADSVAMANIWLAYTYTPTLQNVNLVLEMYKRARTFGPSDVPVELPFTLSTIILVANSRNGDGDNVEADTAEVPVATNAGNGRSHHVSFAVGAESNGASNEQGSYGMQRVQSPTRLENEERRPSSQGGDTPNARQYYSDQPKKASGVEQYLRNSKYNGDLEHSLQNTIRDYNFCSMQLELTPRQKALFFINVFGGTARDYFFEHCHEDMNYDDLVGVIKKGFDNNARQLAIEAELEALTLDKVMSIHGIKHVNEGL